MPNPLFQQLQKSQPMNPMIKQLMDFKKTLSGDPRQIIQTMLNSGKISQAQINQLAQQADELYKQMKGFL